MDIITLSLAKAYAKTYTDEQIRIFSKGMTYKGSVPTKEDLPLEGNAKGDVFTVSDTHNEYVWTSELSSGTIDNWEEFGTVDLSKFYTKNEIDIKINTLRNYIEEGTKVDIENEELIFTNIINNINS